MIDDDNPTTDDEERAAQARFEEEEASPPDWHEDFCSCPGCGWFGRVKDARLEDAELVRCPLCNAPTQFTE